MNTLSGESLAGCFSTPVGEITLDLFNGWYADYENTDFMVSGVACIVLCPFLMTDVLMDPMIYGSIPHDFLGEHGCLPISNFFGLADIGLWVSLTVWSIVLYCFLSPVFFYNAIMFSCLSSKDYLSRARFFNRWSFYKNSIFSSF